ncbi:TrmH family RNA methyltransferase [Candidatus Shikimatogenerans bostrichidophilus]|uniref:TrmH family RNA methyltransferase n=1 Tax=Candidatus Shikimatogenerans bostrichidophilus TaxID=2943807 RepID=UPI00296717DE
MNEKILIYGYHSIKEAINSNKIKILLIIIDKNKIYKYSKLINNIKNNKISIKYLNKNNIDNIINNKNKNNKIINYQGIIAYIYIIKKFTLNNINFNNTLNILILYNITDTKNIGSIIRSSVCLNINLIIIKKNFYIFNPEIIKISSGAIFKINICKVNNIEHTIKFLKKNNIKIISITEKSNKNCINFFKNISSFALIFGNEEKGITNNILSLSNYKIKIPIISKKISSLNVSVACGIILYEINRNKII